jgi:heat shock protein HslJ
MGIPLLGTEQREDVVMGYRQVAWVPTLVSLNRILVCVFTLALYGEALSAPTGPEGIEWQLLKLGGAAVPRLPGNRLLSLLLDAAKKQASGFAGCNNFFGGYELAGATLKFGPLVATRKACVDADSTVETNYFKALARTRGWKIDVSELLLVDGSEVLARFATKQGDSAAIDLETLTVRSKVYTSGPVTLTRGEYRAPAAPGSAGQIILRLSDQRVFTTLSGRQAGAVVFVTSMGGSGSFYELALLSRQADGWVNTDTVLLGDRVKVRTVAIENNVVVVAMTAHGPKDPQCCPTQDAQKRFAIQDNRLVPVSDSASAGPAPITGTVWQWIQTQYSNDKRVAPAKPANYSLRFLEAGQIKVKADCNQKGGTYNVDGKRLSITITHSTMAACEPGSHEDEFVRNLAASAIHFFRNGDLYIDLKYDSGTMKFSAQKNE